jgi:5'-deoxynucleotidase YfbR-like HD superfamily hydrolase
MSSPIREVLYGDLRRVSHVYRYSAQPVLNRENVAEHSWWTAMIAVVIAAEYVNAYDHEASLHDLMGEVALRAILHDIEEVGTGDLVREAKYFSEDVRESFRAVEEAFAHRLFDKFGAPINRMFYHLWKTAKDTTTEGQIVALADLLCVIAYCKHEARMGNLTLAHIEAECRRLINEKFPQGHTLHEIAREAIR